MLLPRPRLSPRARTRDSTARTDRRRSVRGFGVRLCASIVITFALLSATGYVLVGGQLERQLSDGYAAEHAAAASALVAAAARARDAEESLEHMEELVLAMGRQPGVRELLLVDRAGVVTLAADPRRAGTTVRDPRIGAAFALGESHAGREPGRAGGFRLITPVDAPLSRDPSAAERFVLVALRDTGSLDDQLAGVRETYVLVGLVAMIGGTLVFWLVGGRRLLRSHRIALERADRDGLTDLPNHRAFRDDLARDVAVAARHAEPLALALIDLDDFKFLNDRHGHPHGDALLRRVSGVLREIRTGDGAYRVGGDEFGLLLPRTDPAGARAVALRIRRALGDAGISASVGLAALRDGDEADGVLAEAEAALYESKRRGGRGITHFEDIRGEVAVTTPEEVRAVRRLLDEGDVTTAFQPIWDLATGTLLGIEALTRPAAAYGLQGPAHAFDLAQQIGRVGELDELCVRSALSRGHELPPEAFLFVNLSPQTLDLDDDGAWLLDAAVGAGVAPERVVLEVTERFGARTTTVVRNLHRLRAQGFKLALDDLGTGNSGLEMLHAVGAEFVKLDRSIVAGAPSEPNARAVLLAMATFARQTGAFVIAEGIEDAELLGYVRTLDDQLALEGGTIIQGGQGYGLGRPSPELPAAGACLALLAGADA